MFCGYYGDKSMYASEQGILNEQMNAAIMACNNEELKERLLVITMLKPRFGKDGNQYFYILGSLPEPECIAGFGDTPELAMIAFHNEWKGTKTPNNPLTNVVI